MILAVRGGSGGGASKSVLRRHACNSKPGEACFAAFASLAAEGTGHPAGARSPYVVQGSEMPRTATGGHPRKQGGRYAVAVSRGVPSARALSVLAGRGRGRGKAAGASAGSAVSIVVVRESRRAVTSTAQRGKLGFPSSLRLSSSTSTSPSFLGVGLKSKSVHSGLTSDRPRLARGGRAAREAKTGCVRRLCAGSMSAADAAGTADDGAVHSDDENVVGGAFPEYFEPHPEAVEHEKSIAELCDAGQWKNAGKGLQTIRDKGLIPSMLAYLRVVGACRRAVEWDRAKSLYREMVDLHLPENFFEEMACEDFEDESQHVLARAFAIVVEMHASGIAPNYDTYSALLHSCKDDGCGELAILVFEEAIRSNTKLDHFCFDRLVSTMSEQGHKEVGTMLYEMGVVDADKDSFEVDSKDGYDMMWPLNAEGKVLELHNLTVTTALATVQIALLDVMRKPSSRSFWSGKKRLRIITGMGHNSKDGEARIKPAVADMLEDMGLKPEFQQNNEGCIEVTAANLNAYAERLKSARSSASFS